MSRRTKSKAAILTGLLCAVSSSWPYLHINKESSTVRHVALLGSFCDAGLKKLATTALAVQRQYDGQVFH